MKKKPPANENQDAILHQIGRSLSLDQDQFSNQLLNRLEQEHVHPWQQATETQSRPWYVQPFPIMAAASLALVFILMIGLAVTRFSPSPHAATRIASLGVAHESAPYSLPGKISFGETIQTSPEQKASFLLTDASIIRLDQSSSLILQKNRQVRLKQGRLYADVVRTQQNQRFQIVTPQAHIEVIGTAFEVESKNQVTKVTVTEGLVQVKWNQKRETLRKGETLSVASNKRLTPKQKLASFTPAWIEPLQKQESNHPVIQEMMKHFPSRSLDVSRPR